MIGKNRARLSLAWMFLSLLLTAIPFSMAGLGFIRVYREVVHSPQEEYRSLLMQATRAVVPWMLTGVAIAGGSALMLKKKMTASVRQLTREMEKVSTEQLDRKRIEEELIQRTSELEALNEMGALINKTLLDMDTLFPIALEWAVSLTGYEMGGIHLANNEEQTLELKHHVRHSALVAEKAKVFKYGEGVSGKVALLNRPVILSVDDHPSAELAPILKAEGVRTVLGFPLLAKGKLVGTISLLSCFRRELGQRETTLLESIGNQIGIALENAKLFSMASKAKSEWETTFNAVTDMISIRDRGFRVLRVNRAALERYGMEEKALIGKKCFEVFHNLESPCKGCYISEAMETKRAASGERWDPYLKGLFRYYGFPVYGDSGEVVGAISLTRDITEEKRLEREKEAVNNVNRILASNLDVRKVFKAVHSELKTILDSERMTITLLDETRQGFRYFALEKDHDAGDLMTGVTYPRKETPLERVVESGNPVLVNDTKESDSWLGEKLSLEGIRSLLVFPLIYKGNIIGTLNFGNGRAGHFSGEHLDFVRQIAPGLTISIVNSLLVEEMKASEERYRTVVETARDGVSVVGEDFRFNYVNEKMTEILGYSKEELIGSDFRALMDDKGGRTLTGYFGRGQTVEEVSPGCGLRIVRKDGELRNVEISSTIVKDSHGRENTISFMKDVTEKRRMEERLFQAEKLRALGEMASGVAHDFNNALAVILGNAQLLLFSAQDEETTESLKTIEKVVRDSAHTVRRLQEFTSNQIHREALQIDVNGLIRDVIELTRPRWKDEAQKNGIRIQVTFLPGEVPPVAGNSSEVREVLAGLIFNATEAMPRGGRIEIKTFHRKGNAHIEISDTGTGMAEEIRKRVFEPFFTTKPFTNSGLGLSMSYGIIKRHGGDIEVKSRVGEGTTLFVVLPLDPPGEDLPSVSPARRPQEDAAIPGH